MTSGRSAGMDRPTVLGAAEGWSGTVASPMPDQDLAAKLGDLADAAGLRRIHVLAWRDLADVEAGGSEVHLDNVARRWAEAGIDVLVRTSHAQGQLPTGTRHGYQIHRRSGRQLFFLDAPMQELAHRVRPSHRDVRADALLEVWNGMPFFTPLWATVPRVTFIHHVHDEMWRQALTQRKAKIGELIELRIAPRLYRNARCSRRRNRRGATSSRSCTSGPSGSTPCPTASTPASHPAASARGCRSSP